MKTALMIFTIAIMAVGIKAQASASMSATSVVHPGDPNEDGTAKQKLPCGMMVTGNKSSSQDIKVSIADAETRAAGNTTKISR